MVRALSIDSDNYCPVLGDSTPISPVSEDEVMVFSGNKRSQKKVAVPKDNVKEEHSRPSVYEKPLAPPSRLSSLAGSSGRYMQQQLAQSRLTKILLPDHFSGPVHHGWLWKQGSNVKNWKKRFFLLNGATLTYYVDCCVVSTEAAGTICYDTSPKGGMRVASATLSDLTTYGIQVISTGGRVLHLQAGDQASRLMWLEVLHAAPLRATFVDFTHTMVQSFDAPTKKKMNSGNSSESTDCGDHRPTSITDVYESSYDSNPSGHFSDSGPSIDLTMEMPEKRGWLQIRRKVLPGWSLRYIVLSDGRLQMFKTERNPKKNDRSYTIIAAARWSAQNENEFYLRLDNYKELCISCPTADEAQNWLYALRLCL